MDSAQQAEGEKRVRQVLIEPLQRRGLIKPAGMTKAQFEDMVKDLCAKLAGMTEPNLAALEEEAAGLAGGKDRDRFPIANRILERAAQIQPPGDDASPLIRAVFAHQVGRDALTGGWAPELLAELRKSRRWPGAWVLNSVRKQADDALRQMHMFDARLARGEELTDTECRWRDHRKAQMDKCQYIADLAGGGRA